MNGTAMMRLALLSILFLASTSLAQPLKNTKLLEVDGDLAEQMIDGIDRFLTGQTAESIKGRQIYWQRDLSSPEKYAASVAGNRARLAKLLGVVDERVADTTPRYVAGPGKSSLIARGAAFEAHAVRWESLPGMHGEGLLFQPIGREPEVDLILLPDADDMPEAAAFEVYKFASSQLSMAGYDPRSYRVLIPTLVDRRDTHSVAAQGKRPTNQPHREFVYRPAFEMGRHVIGYEIQKVLAAVDWMTTSSKAAKRPLVVSGVGEGGLIALYAGALDTRITRVQVGGCFGPREDLWREPIYRNVFGLLREFGDAEIASLIAPRQLVIDVGEASVIPGPPAPHDGRSGAAPGSFKSPTREAIDVEVLRLKAMTPADWRPQYGHSGLNDAIMLKWFERVGSVDTAARQKRQIDEMQAFTQALVKKSDDVRKIYWSKADRTSIAKWEETTEPLREQFYNDVIGRFDLKLLEANPRTRKVFEEPKYIGYEVMLDVFPDVFAYGILLVPKNINPGERRPVVVCQHGLEGRPQDLADPKIDSPYYHQFAIRLAERGFVTYSPQNPYIFGDRFRMLQRKLNPLGKQLFSIIIPQHQQMLNWLSSLSFVDRDRIAFYGLSYGGTTAMRVPAIEKRYCLSICSGNFNEWIWKTTSLTYEGAYPGTGEYEIFEWNLGHTFNHAEMAGLIAPRPFMVERGHHDPVAPDEWVGYEYGKVRLLYADLGIPQRTTIEYFPGLHEIHAVGTFEFLHKHLRMPMP
jgi:cephalosporin-C deacetylase-like acetyl esterase